MAKKAAKKKSAAKKSGGGELATIEQALNYAGVPTQDTEGKTIETVAGRVIAAMLMLRAGQPLAPGVVFDPHNPDALKAAIEADADLRAEAEDKTA